MVCLYFLATDFYADLRSLYIATLHNWSMCVALDNKQYKVTFSACKFPRTRYLFMCDLFMITLIKLN